MYISVLFGELELPVKFNSEDFISKSELVLNLLYFILIQIWNL